MKYSNYLNHIILIHLCYQIIIQKQRQQQLLMKSSTLTISQNLANKYNKFDHPHQLYQIEEIVADRNLYAQILMKQEAYVIQEVEFLKRFYGSNEFGYKIEMLSEYYKFHRNVPKIFDIGVEETLNKYYNKYRHLDYKNMKHILKEQQNVSITTQKSQSSYTMSICEKKSKYSDMLGPLKQTENDSDSQFLWNFCSDTEKNFKKKKQIKKNMNQFFSCSPIHGQDVRFQKYLSEVGKKHEKQHKFRKTMMRKPSEYIERISQHQNLQAYKPRIKRNTCAQPIKKSIQRTTNNQTMSREQKQKQSMKIDLKNPYKTLRTQFKKKMNNKTLQIKKQHPIKIKKLLRKKSQLNLEPANHFGNTQIQYHKNSNILIVSDGQYLQDQKRMNQQKASTGFLRKNKARSLKKRLISNQVGWIQKQVQNHLEKPLQTDRRKSKSCLKGFQSNNRQASVPILKHQKTLLRKQSSKKLMRVASVTKKNFPQHQCSKENQIPVHKATIEKEVKNLNLQALLHKKLDLFKPHKIF